MFEKKLTKKKSNFSPKVQAPDKVIEKKLPSKPSSDMLGMLADSKVKFGGGGPRQILAKQTKPGIEFDKIAVPNLAASPK